MVGMVEHGGTARRAEPAHAVALLSTLGQSRRPPDSMQWPPFRLTRATHLTAEILIFGTGRTVLPAPREVRDYISSLGIQLDVMDSVSGVLSGWVGWGKGQEADLGDEGRGWELDWEEEDELGGR